MGARALHPFCFCPVGVWVQDVGKKRVEGRSRVSAKKAEAAETQGSEAQESEGTIARPKKTRKKARPVPCIQKHTDREFRRAFRSVCRGLIKKAKAGSTAHTRLLLDIGKSGERKTAKLGGGKSLSEMLLDELKRRQDEREAAADRAKAEEQQTSAKADNEDAASVESVEK